jgi:hypothetical protein
MCCWFNPREAIFPALRPYRQVAGEEAGACAGDVVDNTDVASHARPLPRTSGGSVKTPTRSREEELRLDREVSEAEWKASINKVHAMVSRRARHSVGVIKADTCDGRMVLMGHGGHAPHGNDEEEEEEEREGAKKQVVRQVRMSMTTIFNFSGGDSDRVEWARDATRRERREEQAEAAAAAAAELFIAAAAAAAEICVVQADLTAAGGGGTWAPVLNEYIPRAPVAPAGDSGGRHAGGGRGGDGSNERGGKSVGLRSDGGDPVQGGKRVVYNVQLAPGGQVNSRPLNSKP